MLFLTSGLGLNDEAQFVLHVLLAVAGLLVVAIVIAWHAYGARIAELYDPRDPTPRPKSMSALNIGEPKLASSFDFSRTWHVLRRGNDPARCTPSV